MFKNIFLRLKLKKNFFEINRLLKILTKLSNKKYLISHDDSEELKNMVNETVIKNGTVIKEFGNNIITNDKIKIIIPLTFEIIDDLREFIETLKTLPL